MDYISAQNYEVMNRIFKGYGILQKNIGCEVGVREGKFSEYLLLNNPNLYMVCVDPYTSYQDHSHLYTNEEQKAFEFEAKSRLNKYENRVFCKKYLSVDAAKDFPGGFFDFIYIDAEHTEIAVETDMEAWITKLRSGGVLCGHDFSMSPVAIAVQRVANKYGKCLYSSSVAEGNSWWFSI